MSCGNLFEQKEKSKPARLKSKHAAPEFFKTPSLFATRQPDEG